jgi:type IV pilus assembly protein PilM
VRRGLEEAVQTLAEDVQRSIEYHHSQPESKEVSEVLVSGEGGLVAGFDGYLGELLGVPTHRGNPVGKLAANRSNVSDEQLGAMEPVLAVALGLAMEDE